ncbi:MAG TPA: amidohydrolase [Paracoccaceae bacterium]|nr:amidohydrolase [Paracoccaceae bacterium]
MTADMILTNARVLTMDPARPRAEAVAMAAGRVLAVGARAGIERLAGPETRILDCRGATVLPGFVESHLHLVLGGAELGHLQLGGVHGAAALAARARDFAARHPDAPLIMAQGADYALLGRPATRADLDAVLADRPFAMAAADHHTVWANTAALRAAGLLQGAAMPPGHEVVMGADGLATGELREFEAFAPVIALGGEQRLNLGIATGGEPDPWPDAAAQAIDRAKVLRGLRHCAAQGITSMVNMDGNLYTLRLLDGLRAAGDLLARVKVPFHFKPHMDLAELSRAEEMRAEYDDDWLSSGMVKMFMDGVIDSGTAYRLDDDPVFPGHHALPLFGAGHFAEICIAIDVRRMQIAVHSIGDGAVRQTLDGFAAAQRANGRRDSRHRIEHIEMIDPADIPRLAALGVTASLQPSHPPGAMDFPLQPTLDRIGQARWRDAYRCRTLADHGAVVAFASDWPVSDVSVLRSIRAALTRPAYPGCGDERLGLDEGLAAYSCAGAWAAHRDHVAGRLVPGLAADAVVLGGDIESAAPESIPALGVALTVCGGRVTHAAETAPQAGP